MFLLMQPVSESDMYCVTCGHLFDEKLNICTCHNSEREVSPEWKEAGGKVYIRKVVPFNQYIKDKYESKDGSAKKS